MNLTVSRTALSIAVATSLSPPVWATNNLDQVIVSATRIEQSARDYTGNVTVITHEQLEEKAIQTLPEALDRIGGIANYSNGGLGTTSSVFMRGHDSKRVLLLVDGMRFNDPTGTSGAQWQHLLVSDIERIELIEGAQGVGGVHERGAAAHIDRHAERLAHFRAAGAEARQGLGVKAQAAVAMGGDAESQGDQLLGLFIKRLGLRRGLGDAGETGHRLGDQLVEFLAVGGDVTDDRLVFLGHGPVLPKCQRGFLSSDKVWACGCPV